MKSEINEKNAALGSERSVIREIFEYGNMRAAKIGRENVFDFSLGNPAVPTPDCINESIARLCRENADVHGYTSAQGALSVREKIAETINARFSAGASADDIYMTCGAAASLTITLNALVCSPQDEVAAFAPYFPEYRVFAESAGAVFRAVDADKDSFQISFASLEKTLNENTKAVIINSPNNPTGAVLTEKTLVRLCALLKEKSTEYGHHIYIISDEPYRELVYDNTDVPYMPAMYDDCIVCYSFSKSLSLAGERIGYIFVNPKAEYAKRIYAAVCGAGRALGYVCAPSLMQYAVAENMGDFADIAAYKRRRDLLYNALCDYGYDCVFPDGAFYLFVRSPLDDAKEFCELAKKYELLLVPSDSFGCGGYVRISYCVPEETIKRSLPLFKKLIDSIKREQIL